MQDVSRVAFAFDLLLNGVDSHQGGATGEPQKAATGVVLGAAQAFQLFTATTGIYTLVPVPQIPRKVTPHISFFPFPKLASLDLPVHFLHLPAPVQKSVWRRAFGRISLHIPKAHYPTLFWTGAGSAVKLNETTVY